MLSYLEAGLLPFRRLLKLHFTHRGKIEISLPASNAYFINL